MESRHDMTRPLKQHRREHIARRSGPTKFGGHHPQLHSRQIEGRLVSGRMKNADCSVGPSDRKRCIGLGPSGPLGPCASMLGGWLWSGQGPPTPV